MLDSPDTMGAGIDRAMRDDHSSSFHKYRAQLKSNDGQSYVAFLRTLSPAYGQVYADIALGYAFLLGSAVLAAYLPSLGVPIVIAAALGAIGVGYWVAYLILFLHEGAHYNLAPDKALSDKICNCSVAWLAGASARQYRKIHFQHHRALGTVDDSEFTYFFPLNLAFIVKGLTGIRALEVILARRRYLDNAANGADNATARERRAAPAVDFMLPVTAAIHGIIVSGAILAGYPALALAWLLGLGLVFPFCGALRQLLEHRSDAADNCIDYTKQNHGAFTRMFGSDFLSRTFGGAGFNRHLLHHWEPQVSYTNLPQLEAFLAETPFAEIMRERRSSYTSVFLRLLSLR